MNATALQSEEALLSRIKKQQLIESIDHMSPIYLEGMKRILTVSADTELISHGRAEKKAARVDSHVRR